MIVTCPSCSERYRLSEDKIQGRGARITCPSCGHRFVVYRGEKEPPAPAPRPTAVPVTFARQGNIVRPQSIPDPDEEAPTTLMARGSGYADVRKMLAESQDEADDEASPAHHQAPGQDVGGASTNRFATYAVVAVIGVALLVLAISNGMLG